MRRPPVCHYVDFETNPIQPRPEYPPKPVGVSIWTAGEKKPDYMAFAHYTGGNNCTKEQAARRLRSLKKSKVPICFFNSKFDVDVAQEHMDFGPINWEQIHDPMFLLFLHDPHARDLQLKPSSERLLGMAPDERDAVEEWLWEHRKELATKFGLDKYKDSKGKALINSRSKLGAFIAYAPAEIVGPYANGDNIRTKKLFEHLWPRIVERGMEKAYDREREVMPILLDNERVGLRVDLPLLRKDIKIYSSALEQADNWLRKRLKAPSLNLNADDEVAEVFAARKIIPDDAWTLTAKDSKRSVSKKNLLKEHYSDLKVFFAFGYRNRLSTCLSMFMRPWERQAGARPDRHISTNWNQVRQPGGGTRTGRPSTMDPNFLNLSKTWYDKDDGYDEHPTFLGVGELPLVRRYILPDEDGVFCHRDYNGQELRLLGHFENGALMDAYQENPRLDPHEHVKQLIASIAGLDYHRTQVKITNFRKIYGGGVPATASALNVSSDVARQLLRAHERALPGVGDLNKLIRQMSNAGEPITTWGGREYYVEPPRYDPRFKRDMTYEYKLLNYLIQGSAADVTKEAILRYNKHPKKKGRFLITVYDEINVSADRASFQSEMAVLKEAMESIETDVLMLTDGKTGKNWAELKKYED